MKSPLRVALLPLLALGCLRAEAQPPPPPAPAPRADVVFGTGTLTSDRTIPLAFDRPGTLRVLDATVGAVVEPGAVIARLDDGDTRLAVSREQAALHAERGAVERLRADESLLGARLAIARREAARTGRLFTSGSSSELERDRGDDAATVNALELAALRAQRPALLARVAQAESRLALARWSHARDTLTAPTRARVLRSELAPGAFVGAGQPVVHLSPVGDELASVWVHERELPSLRVGARATVTLRDRARTRFEATVLRVRPEADPRTHEVRVDLRPRALPPAVVFGARLDAEISR